MSQNIPIVESVGWLVISQVLEFLGVLPSAKAFIFGGLFV